MRARFTLPALADIDSIIDHLAERSPSAADRVARRLSEIVEMICAQPEMGKATDDPTIRRFNLTPYPYTVFYEVFTDEVVVMAIRHGARDPASMPGFGGGRS